MTPGMLPTLILALAYGLGALVLAARAPSLRALLASLLGMALGMLGLALFGPGLWGWRSFGVMQAWCWILFLAGPAYFLAFAAIWRDGRLGCLVAALGLAAIGVDAFFVEPQWLEVNHVALRSAELSRPLRIGLVADLQTDAPGDYEREALRRLMEEDPDIVLFAGDLIHLEPGAPYAAERDAMRSILRESGVARAPLGAYAVQGDVDRDDWWLSILDGTGIDAGAASRTLSVGEFTLTLLSIQDSRAEAPPVPKSAGFHVVLAHSPDYALAAPEADLLLAGHTHGGQVRLPLIGPLVTASRIPRAWAAGQTTLAGGQELVVSRGVGMERRDAPRLRFLCRPELVIVEIQPGS